MDNLKSLCLPGQNSESEIDASPVQQSSMMAV